jgi:hypothetical protein
MIGAKESTQIVLAILRKGRVRLKLWVTIVGLIVVADGLASRAKANKAEEGVGDTGFLHAVFHIGEICVDDDVGSEGN